MYVCMCVCMYGWKYEGILADGDASLRRAVSRRFTTAQTATTRTRSATGVSTFESLALVYVLVAYAYLNHHACTNMTHTYKRVSFCCCDMAYARQRCTCTCILASFAYTNLTHMHHMREFLACNVYVFVVWMHMPTRTHWHNTFLLRTHTHTHHLRTFHRTRSQSSACGCCVRRR